MNIGDKVVVLRNGVNAHHPVDECYLKPGDIIEIARIDSHNIDYFTKIYGSQSIPRVDVKLAYDNSKCRCDRFTLWTEGCQCGRIVG